MRIHYLVNGLNGGGAAFPIPDLVACMQARGHRVQVLALAPQDGKSAARLTAAGIDWQLLAPAGASGLAVARALQQRVRADRPDLLWTSLTRATVYGQLIGWRQQIPVVSWQHNAFLKPGNRLLLRATRELTSLWVADSETVAEFTAQKLGMPATDIVQWPIFKARAEAPQCSLALPGARLRIGSLGRLHPNKCYTHLIQAAARLKAEHPTLSARLELVVGGSGEQRDALVAEAHALGLDNVHFIGFVQDPAAFLAGLQGYIQTSHHEGMCIAAHEAMQAGLPVIATAVGELQRSVQPGHTGWLCPVGDVAALTAALASLASDPSRAAEMGRAGRAHVLARYGDVAFRQAADAVLARVESLVAARG